MASPDVDSPVVFKGFQQWRKRCGSNNVQIINGALISIRGYYLSEKPNSFLDKLEFLCYN